MEFPCLYTKHIRQKRKVYHDGFLRVADRSVTLLSEDHQIIASSRLAPDDRLGDGQGILVEAYLVECEQSVEQDQVQEAFQNRCTTKSHTSAIGLKKHSGVSKLRAPATVSKPRTDDELLGLLGAWTDVQAGAGGHRGPADKQFGGTAAAKVSKPIVPQLQRRPGASLKPSQNHVVSKPPQAVPKPLAVSQAPPHSRQLREEPTGASSSSEDMKPPGISLPAGQFRAWGPQPAQSPLHQPQSTGRGQPVPHFPTSAREGASIPAPHGVHSGVMRQTESWSATAASASGFVPASIPGRSTPVGGPVAAVMAVHQGVTHLSHSTAPVASVVSDMSATAGTVWEHPNTAGVSSAQESDEQPAIDASLQQAVNKWKKRPLHNVVSIPPSRPSKMQANNERGPGSASAGNCSASGIRCPSARECAQPAERSVAVPDSFPGLDAYKDCWQRAIVEELNLRLRDTARIFHRVFEDKAGAASGLSGAASGQRQPLLDLQRTMRNSGINVCFECELQVVRKFAGKQDGESEKENRPTMLMLTVKNWLGKASDLHKDDIWVLSTTPSFTTDVSGVGDRLKKPWVAVAQGMWHGRNKEGRMQIQFLSEQPNLQKTQVVHAIRAFEAATELAMLGVVQGLNVESLPILPKLLERDGPAHMENGAAPLPSDFECEDLCQGLNPEQREVVQRVVPWFQPGLQGADPVCIIHGPFGTGKSSLLISLIRLILRLGKAKDSGLRKPRILVAAHTNVAVDRILVGLLEAGMLDFIRVGALRRMDKRLLGHSLHCSGAKGGSDAAKELGEMLAEAKGAEQKACIQEEMNKVKAGAEQQRKRMLKTVPVVGVTCCSAALPVLDGLALDICILDECSQIVEPLSLLPMVRSKCKYLIAAGDPCQLPPVVAAPAQVKTSNTSSGEHVRLFGMARPLFERLVAMGHRRHLLRCQYRCHPALSQIPNQLYYNGLLRDGVSTSDRPPLICSLPPLMFLDVRGGTVQYDRGRSASNRQEAAAIINVVRTFLTAGVAPSQIGVICLFRAQVSLVKGLLGNCTTKLQEVGEDQDANVSHGAGDIAVATIDSFQGLEKDIIILSTTVMQPEGFASDAQRLNVALTRGRNHLLLVGYGPALAHMPGALHSIVQLCKAMPNAYHCGMGLCIP